MASMLTVPLLIGQVSMLMDRVTDVGLPGKLICLQRFPGSPHAGGSIRKNKNFPYRFAAMMIFTAHFHFCI